MKKTNFVVVFWLILTLISFIVFLFNFNSFWQYLSSLIFPIDGSYLDKNRYYRQLFSVTPMLIVTVGFFYAGLRQALKVYNQS